MPGICRAIDNNFVVFPKPGGVICLPQPLDEDVAHQAAPGRMWFNRRAGSIPPASGITGSTIARSPLSWHLSMRFARHYTECEPLSVCISYLYYIVLVQRF